MRHLIDFGDLPRQEWDELYAQLRRLEAETGVVLPDSPTQRVAANRWRPLSRTRTSRRCIAWIRCARRKPWPSGPRAAERRWARFRNAWWIQI